MKKEKANTVGSVANNIFFATEMIKAMNNDIDKVSGYVLSLSAYEILEDYLPKKLRELMCECSIRIDGAVEEISIVPIYKSFSLNPINNSLNFKSINFKAKLKVNEDECRQLLKGGEPMELNLKGLTQEQLDSL